MSKAEAVQGTASGAAAGGMAGGPYGAAIGGGIGLAGTLIGASNAKQAERAARRAREQAMALLAGVELPEMQELLYKYGSDALPEVVGTLSPEQEQTFLTDSSAMEDVSVDPRLADAQMAALNQLQEVSQGGLTEADMMAAEQIRRQTSAQDQAKQGQILQEMSARGMGGSGAELIARLKSSQSAADRSSSAGMDLLQQAQARALQAMSQQGGMAGSMRSQEFGEQSQVAQAKDVINQFNTNQRTGAASRNTAATNQARQYNLDRSQGVSDQRAGIRREQEQQRVNATQQDYDNRYGRAQDQANIMAGNAAQSERDAARRAQLGADVGTTVGNMVGSYMSQKK